MWISVFFLLVLVLNEVSKVKSQEPSVLNRACPFGWQKFGSQCFKFFKEKKTWTEAEQQCLANKGNLASIHSEMTSNFLKSFVKKEAGGVTRTWIGAHDSTQNFIWFWSDGTKFVYKDWHTGEPNNSEGVENCVEMGYGAEVRWNDAHCATLLPFICHKMAKIASP